MASVAELDVLIRMQSEGQSVLNALNGQLIGVALAAGAVYEIGKVVVTNYEDQQKAAKDLEQAFGTQGKAVPVSQIQAFLSANKELIANQYDAEKAIGAATRAGFSFTDAMHMENEAMGLSIINGRSMADNMDTLIKASQGQGRALLDLGIKESAIEDPVKAVTTAQKAATAADTEKAKADRALQEELDKLHSKHTVTQADLDHLADLKAKDLAATQNDTQAHNDLSDAQIALAESGGKWAEVQALIDARLKGTNNDLTETDKTTRALNKDWQDFTAQNGPPVVGMLNDIATAADTALQIMDELGTIISTLESAPGKIGTAAGVVANDLGFSGGNQHVVVQRGGQQMQVGSPQQVQVRVQVSADPGTVARVLRSGMQT